MEDLTIDGSLGVGFLAPAQVGNNLIEIVVVFSGIRIAVMPHLCDDFIFIRFHHKQE